MQHFIRSLTKSTETPKQRRLLAICLVSTVVVLGLGSSFVNELPWNAPKGPPIHSNDHVPTVLGGLSVEKFDQKKPLAPDNAPVIKNQLIVVIPKAEDRLQFGNKLQPIEYLPDTFYLEVDGPESLKDKQTRISELPGVEDVEPNSLVSADAVTLNSLSTFEKWQWGIEKINARTAWQFNRGSAATVAVIDTGVRAAHVELSSSVDVSRAHNFVTPGQVQWVSAGKTLTCNNTDTWDDQDSHGTAVASIITASGDSVGMAGVAPAAHIMPVRVLGCNGVGTNAWEAQGIRYATDHLASIINLSLSGSGSTCSKAETSAIAYALSKGVVVVAASGNDGVATIGCPARLPGVIAVGAIDRYQNLVSNSTWGSNYGPQQSVVAPGIQIAVACSCNGYAYNTNNGPTNHYLLKFNGTSAATPFVAGTAALILTANPSLLPNQVKSIIERTATDPLHGTLPNDRYGHGIVNAYAAVRAAH